jgi:sugar phosphate isomerase/epimerase
MKLGIFEAIFPEPTLAEKFDRLAQMGFEAVQFNLESAGLEMVPEEVPAATMEVIDRARLRAGIEISALAGTYNMIDPDREARELHHARLRNLIPVAADLNIPLITLCTGTRDTESMWRGHPDNQSGSAWIDLVSALQPLLDDTARHNVSLGIEPEPANVINNASRARQLIDELGSDRLRIIFDPANIVAGDQSRIPSDVLSDAFDLLGDRISLAHAKDLSAAGEFCAAGTGVVPWGLYGERLRSSGYTGAVILHSLALDEIEHAVNVLANAGIRGRATY